MREIKFRGKRKDNGEWVFGHYKHDGLFNNHFILWQELPHYQDCYACVIPETIGQFTGLKDNNGTEIYEDDICRMVISYDYGLLPKNNTYVVKHNDNKLGYMLGDTSYRLTKNKVVEVIGNIHEGEQE